MNLPKLIIQRHKNYRHRWFRVVRGDLYQGGVKCRVLTELLAEEVWQREVVYAGCYFGHSGFALGLAGLLSGKKVNIFLPAPKQDTDIYRQMMSLNNVSRVIVDTAVHQDGAFGEARRYAEKKDAYLMPIGFDYEPFIRRYVSLIRSVCKPPEEVWVSGGSGVTAKCLQLAWPKAKINVVNLNVRPNAHFGNPHAIWNVPEALNNSACLPPPWPASEFYDAKIWRFVQDHASPDALIWSIA